MNPWNREFLLGGGPGPAHFPQDTEPVATMANGVNGVGAGGDGGSSSGSDSVTAAQARELKRQRLDIFNHGSKAHQPAAHQPDLPGRHCFVSVGATAGFRSLLDEVSTAGFLASLAGHGFASLEVQCGPDHSAIWERLARLTEEERRGVAVSCFAYTGNMHAHIINCRGLVGVRPAGCVIAHGGKSLFCSHLGVASRLGFVATHASSQAQEPWGRYWASAPH
jgi:beta-1,4-N-acetylglucosaminyltransferase